MWKSKNLRAFNYMKIVEGLSKSYRHIVNINNKDILFT